MSVYFIHRRIATLCSKAFGRHSLQWRDLFNCLNFLVGLVDYGVAIVSPKNMMNAPGLKNISLLLIFTIRWYIQPRLGCGKGGTSQIISEDSYGLIFVCLSGVGLVFEWGEVVGYVDWNLLFKSLVPHLNSHFPSAALPKQHWHRTAEAFASVGISDRSQTGNDAREPVFEPSRGK